MRSIVRPVLLAIVTALAALAIGPATATAGGPTSVLIVNPSTGATASQYATDADYATLQEALEPSDIWVDPMPSLSAGPGTPAINITWLVHDVSVWRVDHVRLDFKYVFVQTQTTDFVELGRDGEWHVAGGGKAVSEVLLRLGVVNEPLKLGDTKAARSEKDAAAVAKDDIAPMATESSSTSSSNGRFLTGWWWLLPGVIVGAALAVVGRPYVLALAARREPGPRHQLIDL